MICIQEGVVRELVGLGFKVIVLSPLTRHFAPCCTGGGHFDDGFDPVALNELIRDGGTFLCRKLNSFWDESPRRVVAVHPERIFPETVYVAGSVICNDHVHLKDQTRFKLTQALVDLAIELVANSSVVDWFDGRAIPEGLGLEEWIVRYRNQSGAALPKIDVSGARPCFDSPTGRPTPTGRSGARGRAPNWGSFRGIRRGQYKKPRY